MTEPAATTYVDQIAASIYAVRHGGRHAGQPLPPPQRGLYLGYAVLALVLGEKVELEDVHHAWAAWATVHDPHNDALRPFAELSPRVQALDRPFRDAIRRVAGTLPAPAGGDRAGEPSG